MGFQYYVTRILFPMVNLIKISIVIFGIYKFMHSILYIRELLSEITTPTTITKVFGGSNPRKLSSRFKTITREYKELSYNINYEQTHSLKKIRYLNSEINGIKLNKFISRYINLVNDLYYYRSKITSHGQQPSKSFNPEIDLNHIDTMLNQLKDYYINGDIQGIMIFATIDTKVLNTLKNKGFI